MGGRWRERGGGGAAIDNGKERQKEGKQKEGKNG